MPHYLTSGAIVAIEPPAAGQQFLSRCFFVPKSTGGFRLTIDLRTINSHFVFPKVNFENLSVLRYASTALTTGFSIDISDAYHHLRLHPAIENYFQFRVAGQWFVARGLPIGWAPAPMAFTKFVRVVLRALRHPAGLPDTWSVRTTLMAIGDHLSHGSGLLSRC